MCFKEPEVKTVLRRNFREAFLNERKKPEVALRSTSGSLVA